MSRIIILSVCMAALAVAALGTATTAAAAQGDGCIQAPKVTKFLSRDADEVPDHSYAKLTWAPEFCPNGNTWKSAATRRY